MADLKQNVKTITSKDEKQAIVLLTEMIDNSDTDLFKELVKQSEYLFPFIIDNVCERFEKSIKASNYKNLLNFFDCYSPFYDRIFAMAVKVFGDAETKEKMLHYLKNGSTAQKTYAARYFEKEKNYFSAKNLIDNAFSDDEYLADACAAALGILNEQKSYDIALEKLQSSDDFEALKGLNFFVSYIKNPPMEDIFEALNKSGMPENFAGKIAYIKPLPQLVQEDLKNSLTVTDNILTGFGEILPLSEVFNFELYDTIGMLSETGETEYSSQIASVLLRAKQKFEMLSSNEEYIFDEDKNTKEEIFAINKLLNSFGKGFWGKCEKDLLGELEQDVKRIHSALEIIRENRIKEAVPNIIDMLYENEDETIICEGVTTLKAIDGISFLDKDDILSKFENENLKIITAECFK